MSNGHDNEGACDLAELPNLSLLIAPVGSGKSSIIKYLVLKHASLLPFVIIFSNIGVDAYEENYGYLNPKYIRDEFDQDFLDSILKLAKKIRSKDPTRRFLVIFDDVIGMAKKLFSTTKAKRLLTTMRHYGISIVVSVQQLQNEVTTLIRNNTEEVFFFKQSDPAGLKLAYETWGRPSGNLQDRKEFDKTLKELEDHTFLHYSRSGQTWNKGKTPYPLPDFRLRLHPEDNDCGKPVIIYGNKDNYNLSSIEKAIDLMDVEDDKEPLYIAVDKPTEEDVSEVERDIEDGSSDEDLNDTLEQEPKPESKSKPKKPKQNAKKASKRTKKSDIPVSDDSDSEPDNPIAAEILSDKDKVVRLRCIQQLCFAGHDPIIRREVETVFPGFFDQDFYHMPYSLLRSARRKMKSAIQIQDVVGSVKTQYDMLGRVSQLVVSSLSGYKGPHLAVLPSLFHRQASMSTLDALGKINPYQKNIQQPWEKMLNFAYPALAVYQECSQMVEYTQTIKEIGEESLDPEDLSQLRKEIEEEHRKK